MGRLKPPNDENEGERFRSAHEQLRRVTGPLRRSSEWFRGKIAWYIVGGSFVIAELTLLSVFHYVGLNVRTISTALFLHASVSLSIAFHFFSVGNTVFSCAASLEDDYLREMGEQINTSGKYMMLSAILFVAATLLSYLSTSTTSNLQMVVFLPFVAAAAAFASGLINQYRVSTWYERLEVHIENDDRPRIRD